MKEIFLPLIMDHIDIVNVVCADVWDMEEVGQVGQVMVGLSDVVHVLQMASLLPVPPQLDTQG